MTQHDTATDEEQPAVSLAAVTKSFGRAPAFKALTFTVGTGELVEVIGPSGSGKSTLLRLLHGQLRPSSGEVWVARRGLHRWWRRGLGRLRRDVAFIFQEQRLLPRLNALENIVIALQIRGPQLPYHTIKERSLAALESVKLAHKRRLYPHQLSAGERQRVAIARALVVQPRILLADEPLNSLDDKNAEVITRLLEAAAAKGTTVIVATHRHTFAARRLLLLPTGKVMISRKASMNGYGNGHAKGKLDPEAASSCLPRSLWRLVIPFRERKRRSTVVHDAVPLWRRFVALTANSFRLIVFDGLRSWGRNVRLAAPALGTIALVLALAGTLALVGIAVERVIADQANQASLVRVYLAQDATPEASGALKTRLTSDPRVASINEVSPEQALAEAGGRPGLNTLASLSSTNPFPASLDVRVKLVTQVEAVANSVKGDPAVDSSYPTSYDPDTYSRLRQFAAVAGGIALGILLLFAFVAYAVIANSMRGVAAARREEVTVMRLLGARGWMTRGPFVIEGLTTGAIAGALAAGAVGAAYPLSVRFEDAIYVQVLPGIDVTAVRYVLAAVITAGLVLGSATAWFGIRRART